jgi:hypothetical protein
VSRWGRCRRAARSTGPDHGPSWPERRRGEDVGSGNASELGTYVVEKGKPLITLAE